MARVRPNEARSLFVRKLHEQNGSMRGAAAQLGIHPRRAYQFLYGYGLRGKPAEIRKRVASRFRLPAA